MMIRETELNLLVPSPELLVRLASGERPLGVRAGPPRIRSIRETFFDTPDQTLRRRGMTCKLRQVQGEDPAVVVTVGEDPDSEGITSRSRLTAAAIGTGVFETLRGDSEPALQIQRFLDPGQLRPQIALDIQRLGRVFRGGILLKPVLLLLFDRITVQTMGASSVFHEISVRRRREGGPLIRDIARALRDEFHLFPDGMSRLQRAYRLLAVERKTSETGLSPYGLNLALAVFSGGKLALVKRGNQFHIPTFRGSGEDAARALSADLTGDADLPLLRLGTTEPREGRAVAELWTIPDTGTSLEGASTRSNLTWIPWQELLMQAGHPSLRDPTLISSLLLLSRKKLLGQLPWVEGGDEASGMSVSGVIPAAQPWSATQQSPELRRVEKLLPLLTEVEDQARPLRFRLEATSRLSEAMDRIFFQDVTRTKGMILSGSTDEEEDGPTRMVDLISIRIRGIADRLYQCFEKDLVGELEKADIHIRTWNGLMHADRMAFLEMFSAQILPSMQVAPEWGPSFIPEMPLAGSAIGLLARFQGGSGTRFFHMVVRKAPPAFLTIPGTGTVLPLEEVVRGYFLHQMPDLQRAETHMFRFTTGAATVVEMETAPEPAPDATLDNTESPTDGDGDPEGTEGEARSPTLRESRQSVVVRVLVRQRMPESYQAQLLRALERQVSRRNPLIGWSDLYPLTGPLELSGLHRMLEPE